MTSLQTEASPQATVPLVESEQPFWRYFADTGVSYFKWAYGGTFLIGIAYYTFRLFQWWGANDLLAGAGVAVVFAAVFFAVRRLWRAKVESSKRATSAKNAIHPA